MSESNVQGRRNRFRTALTPTAAAVAAVAALSAGQAQAQQDQQVTVTGIRGAIESAISVKKNADNIVEVINAEDVGKLPDNSIAEAIARLPGVTAQRNRDTGRAQEVSLRGMPSTFGTALLNGREQSTTSFNRGVEFDQYPSELLGSVVIYKTPVSNVAGQGLSGTIDLRTLDPLSVNGRRVAVNLRNERTGVGLSETGSGKRLSLSYIDQFADRTIGLALGFARLDGKSGGQTSFDSWGSGEFNLNGTNVSVPHNGFNEFTDVNTRTRDGMMAVLEFRPSKNVTSKIDLFYSKFITGVDRVGFGGPLNDAWGDRSPYDRAPGLINTNVVGGKVVSGTWTEVRAFARNDPQKSDDRLKSMGWNTKMKLSPKVSALLDLGYSSATRDWQKFDTTASTVGPVPASGATNLTSISFTGSGAKYSSSLNFADPNIIKLTDPQGWGGSIPQAGYLNNPKIDEVTKTAKLSSLIDLGDGGFFSQIDVGLNLSDRTKDKNNNEYYLTVKGSETNKFAAVNVPNPSIGYAGASMIPVIKWDMFAYGSQVFNYVERKQADPRNKDWEVNERLLTGYLKADVDSKLFGLPVRGNLGISVAGVDQSSTATALDNSNGSTLTPPQKLVTEGRTYVDVLPTSNLIFDLGSSNLLRVALGKQVARPDMEAMRASRTFSIDTSKQIYTGDGGNPKLSPFRATALDVSFEKYVGNKAYFAAAAFFKDIDSFIVNYTNANFDFTPYLLPTTVVFPSKIGQFSMPINGKGGSIKGVELTGSLPLDLLTPALKGFGVVASMSNTSSSVKLPNTAGGSSASMPLPGLSRQVTSLMAYYEAGGFSARVARRSRSAFVGSVVDVFANRTTKFIAPEAILDTQIGYEIGSGYFKGLSVLFQANNLTNTEFKQYENTPDNVTYRAKFGRTYMLGVNYKF